MTNAHIISTAGATALLCTVAIAKADVLDLPPHSHAASPVTTWPGGPIDETEFHQHRTNHHVNGAGAIAHLGPNGLMIPGYSAFGTWQNDRSYHFRWDHNAHGAGQHQHGHDDWGHGHVEPKKNTRIRYHVHTAAIGGDISEQEATEWNGVGGRGAAPRVMDAFNAWQIAANASGSKNWPNANDDNDHVEGTGVAWHSHLNFMNTAGPHEIHVRLGEASDGHFCGAGALGCWDPETQTIIIDDDADVGGPDGWYYGTSTDNNVADNQFDLLTTLIHEVGHVTSLNHFGSFAAGAIMHADGQALRGNTTMGGDGHGQGIFRTIDPSAIHGVRDLYAIAVPEPASLALLALSGLMFRRGRRQ